MDGRERIERVRSNEPTAALVNLAVTGHAGAEDQATAGANGLVSKPFDRDELIARVTSLVG